MPTLIGVYVRDGVPQQTGLEGREVRELLVRHQIGQVVVDQGEVHAHLTHREGFKRSHYNQHNVRRLKKRGKHLLGTIQSDLGLPNLLESSIQACQLYAAKNSEICNTLCGKFLQYMR